MAFIVSSDIVRISWVRNGGTLSVVGGGVWAPLEYVDRTFPGVLGASELYVGNGPRILRWERHSWILRLLTAPPLPLVLAVQAGEGDDPVDLLAIVMLAAALGAAILPRYRLRIWDDKWVTVWVSWVGHVCTLYIRSAKAGGKRASARRS